MIRRTQQGISTITVIFLITLMAALGAASMSMLRSSRSSELQTLQMLRARQAALAGIEYGLHQVAIPGAPVCNAATNLANLPETLAQFVVTVTCIADGPYTEGAVVSTRYRITATACNVPLGALAPLRCPNDPASVAADTGWRYVEAVERAEWRR